MRVGYLAMGVAGLLLCSSSVYAADVTGTVNVIGHVTGTCAVLDGASSTSFSGQIDLGELDDPSTGLLDSGLSGSTSASPAGSQSFRVVCNTGTPGVQLSATRLGDGVTAQTGYTSFVDFTTTLKATTTTGSNSFNYTTAAAPPAATTGNLTAPLSGLSGDITVNVYGLTTDGGVLTAGTYGSANGGTGGVISITITPS